MRETFELVERLRYAGGHIRVQGKRVHVEAPPGAVGPQLKKELKRAKPEILELENWYFRRMVIANQENPGMNDIWMVGNRINGERGVTFWFVEQEAKN
jgi:hypothetical protein